MFLSKQKDKQNAELNEMLILLSLQLLDELHTLSRLYQKLDALEKYLGIEYIDEVIENKGYRKIKKSQKKKK